MNTTKEIIDDLKEGKMVIIVDDEDRENEGDLVCAADKVDSDIVNFMAKHGRGLICLTLTKEKCSVLGLKQMTDSNESSNKTAFTVSIEAKEGITTGISAQDELQLFLQLLTQMQLKKTLLNLGMFFHCKQWTAVF